MAGSAQRPKNSEARDGCISRILSFQLQKSPAPNFREKCGIPPTFQRAFLNRECGSSNPPRSASQSDARRLCPLQRHKGPPMAGFCELAIGLRAPELGSPGAKSPIVSGGYLKYSRFREAGAGDGVRSKLRGRACSANRPFLRHDRRKSGVSSPYWRAELGVKPALTG
jgi:hypothetical protein